MTKESLGYTDAQEFRAANQYVETERLFTEQGLTEAVENKTPPVCVNIAHLSTMESIQGLQEEFPGRSLRVAILGISSARGPKDFQDLLKSLGAGYVSTTALDISNGIFTEVEATGLDEILCLERDARDTGLVDSSQDLVLRDHLGNCCPPVVDRAINAEVGRIVKPGGISVVNITTSDFLLESEGRGFVSFEKLQNSLESRVVEALQHQVYDLEELATIFSDINTSQFKGLLLEIEPNRSFVVFGEDQQGHGEWFRSLEDHLSSWQQTGFEIMEIKSREGLDSHVPPLKCKRHNVVLRKMSREEQHEVR